MATADRIDTLDERYQSLLRQHEALQRQYGELKDQIRYIADDIHYSPRCDNNALAAVAKQIYTVHDEF